MPMSPVPFDCVVFDLDGTLIDSAPDIARALNRTLGDLGRPPLDLDRVISMVGDGSPALLRRALRATGPELAGPEFQDALGRFLDVYYEESETPSCLYPGVTETLAELSVRGVALGLCTNKPERITRRLLGFLGLEALFAAVAGGDTLPVKKPDGRHLGWVIETLGGGRAAMVGDNANDVQAARSAGVPVVAVSYGYPRMPVGELGADVVIDRFPDLPEALARLPRA